MLWNNIYDYFVRYIFGGVIATWNGTDYEFVTYYTRFSTYTGQVIGNGDFFLSLFGQNITLGNYLSFVATLITIVIIFILCCFFIKKIVSLMGKLFSGGTL